MNLKQIYLDLFCVKWTAEKHRKRGETFFYTFCTISFLFPPLRPLSAECAEYAFHGQEDLEPARTEERGKKRHKAGEKGREGNVPPFSHCNIERWIYYPENLTDFFFFFKSRSSRNTGLPLRPEYLDRVAVTHSDAERGKKTFAAKCTTLCVCPAACHTGVLVRQPILGLELRFGCGWKY